MLAIHPSSKHKYAGEFTARPPGCQENMDREMGIEHVQGVNQETAIGAVTPERFVKSISHSDVKLSESSLCEGFNWQPRQPIRPGQFSERPQKHLQNNHPGEPTISLQPNKIHETDDIRNKEPSTKSPQKEPLKLPELVFYNSNETKHPPERPIASPTTVPTAPEAARPDVSITQEKNRRTVPFLSPGQASTSREEEMKIEKTHLLSSPHQGKLKKHQHPMSTCFSTSIDQNNQSLFRDNTEPVTQKPPTKTDVLQAKKILDHSPKHHHRQQSHSSRCGDLEAPRYQSPKFPRGAPRASSRDSPRRDRSSRGCSDKEGGKQGRSNSRNSNISRKRSAVSKPQARRDSKRKHEAMVQMAQYWNQCLEINENEKAAAKEEIEQLHKKLKGVSQQFEDAMLLLNQKQSQINELESQNVELKEHDNGTTSQNMILTDEVDGLRKELSNSNTKISHLGEKCKVFKKKINEALTEQQDLYGQVESSFKATITELQQEKAKREAQTKEIDCALNISEQKREEMKRAFDDIHARDQNEIHQNIETISILKNEISAQHEEIIAREKVLAENLQRQSDMHYQNGQQKLQDIESKIDLVVEACRQTFQRENENSSPVASISNKIDLMMETIGGTSDKNQQMLLEITKSAFVPVSLALEDRVLSQLLPRIIEGFSKYNELEKTILMFGRTFENKLTSMEQALSWQLQGRIDQSSNTSHVHDKIINLLKNLSDGVDCTKELCEGTRNAQLELTNVMGKTMESTTESESRILEKKIEERDAKINDLWLQLVSLKDQHSASLEEASTKGAAQELAVVKQLFQDNSDQITQSFQKSFDKERELLMEKIRQNEEENESLRTYIQQEIRKVLDFQVKDSPDLEKLEEQLRGERRSVASLTQKIENLEQEAQKAEVLRGQWHQGLSSVGILRAKLEATAQRLPKVEALATRLNEITRLNDIIHSTKNFLEAENRWVETELSARGKLQTPNPGYQDHLDRPDILNSQQPTLELNIVPAPPNLLAATQNVEVLVREDLHEEDTTRRKVMVHSPTGDSGSPSPPPSIGQEQRRRREAIRPRSILRSSSKLFQKTQASQGGEFLGHPLHHNPYNRPMVGVTTSASGNKVGSVMINHIQSTLIPPRHYQQDWEFPTVAEFEESVRLGTQKREHDSLVAGNIEDHVNKKIKEEDSIISPTVGHNNNESMSPQG